MVANHMLYVTLCALRTILDVKFSFHFFELFFWMNLRCMLFRREKNINFLSPQCSGNFIQIRYLSYFRGFKYLSPFIRNDWRNIKCSRNSDYLELRYILIDSNAVCGISALIILGTFPNKLVWGSNIGKSVPTKSLSHRLWDSHQFWNVRNLNAALAITFPSPQMWTRRRIKDQ